MDYGARFYVPTIGRFVSADSVTPDIGNPQNLNHYAYTLNNPSKYVDHDGHFAILASMAVGALVGGAIVAGTHLVTTLGARRDIDLGHAAISFGAGAVAGALIGTGIGAAQGIAGLSAATAMAVSSVAIGTGVGGGAAAEAYLTMQSITAGPGSGDNFDTSDFMATFVSNSAAGGINALVKSPVGRVAIDSVVGGAGQAAFADSFKCGCMKLDAERMAGEAIVYGAFSTIEKFIPLKKSSAGGKWLFPSSLSDLTASNKLDRKCALQYIMLAQTKHALSSFPRSYFSSTFENSYDNYLQSQQYQAQ